MMLFSPISIEIVLKNFHLIISKELIQERLQPGFLLWICGSIDHESKFMDFVSRRRKMNGLWHPLSTFHVVVGLMFNQFLWRHPLIISRVCHSFEEIITPGHEDVPTIVLRASMQTIGTKL